MRVVVYPRLHQALTSRNVTLGELELQLKDRFGASIQTTPLYWLMLEDEPVRRVNLEVVAAAATVLDMPLSALFSVQFIQEGVVQSRETRVLNAVDSRRLAYLLDKPTPTDVEQSELDALISTYGHVLRRRRIEERAEKEGLSVEQVRRESDVQIEQDLQWLHTSDADLDDFAGAIKRRLSV